jgi:hypothetical protein
MRKFVLSALFLLGLTRAGIAQEDPCGRDRDGDRPVSVGYR